MYHKKPGKKVGPVDRAEKVEAHWNGMINGWFKV